MSLLRLFPRSTLSRTSACTTVRAFRTTPARAKLFENVTDPEVFKKTVAQKDRITIVDFYADWCGPCRQLSPTLERLTAEPNTTDAGVPFDLLTIDVDSDLGQQLGQQFKVAAIPTVVAMHDSAPLSQFRGNIGEANVKTFLTELEAETDADVVDK